MEIINESSGIRQKNFLTKNMIETKLLVMIVIIFYFCVVFYLIMKVF
jgi:hypothetical protein